MSQKVIFNGIEISQPKYDSSILSIFDYLDRIRTLLERGLSKEDKNSQFSVNVDFASNTSPRYKVHANGSTKKKTKEKIVHILDKKVDNDFSYVAGWVKVNFLVEDRK